MVDRPEKQLCARRLSKDTMNRRPLGPLLDVMFKEENIHYPAKPDGVIVYHLSDGSWEFEHNLKLYHGPAKGFHQEGDKDPIFVNPILCHTEPVHSIWVGDIKEWLFVDERSINFTCPECGTQHIRYKSDVPALWDALESKEEHILHIQKRDRADAGSCNFCYTKYRKVFVITAHHIEVRMCAGCLARINKLSRRC